MPSIKKFWQFRNQTEESAELLLYGDISETSWWGDEVTAKQFAEDLKGVGNVNDITVRINSGGGDVFAAQAIGNLLEQHAAKITAKIDGLCASAATIVACHCDKVVAALDSTYMIHPVKMGLFGYADATTLQQYLDALAAIRENIVSLYARKTGRAKDEVAEQMDATSWMTGAEAKENGFVDEVLDETEDTVTENRGGLLFVNGVGTHLPYEETPFMKNLEETIPFFQGENKTAEDAGVGKAGEDQTPEAQTKESKVQNTTAAGTAAEGFVNITVNPDNEPGKPKNHKEVGNMEISTVDELREAYPELVGQVEAAAAENATAAERQRIKDISEMSMKGNESMANDAMFENPISASDFAVQSVKNAKAAEEQQKQAYLNGVQTDVANSGMNKVNQETPENHETDEFMDALHSLNQNK